MENNNMNFTPPPQNAPMGPAKACKHCKSRIPKAAKICPYCHKKQGGIAKWIILGLVVFIIICGVINSLNGGSEGEPTASTNTEGSQNAAKEAAQPKEYTPYAVQNLVDDLRANAMAASETYKGKDVELSGVLSNIDSSGKYISIKASENDFSLVNVMCNIKNDEQKTKIMELSTGSPVTVKGTVKDVGEVFGYTIDMDEIQ